LCCPREMSHEHTQASFYSVAVVATWLRWPGRRPRVHTQAHTHCRGGGDVVEALREMSQKPHTSTHTHPLPKSLLLPFWQLPRDPLFAVDMLKQLEG
jgi:hypothetical protein